MRNHRKVLKNISNQDRNSLHRRMERLKHLKKLKMRSRRNKLVVANQRRSHHHLLVDQVVRALQDRMIDQWSFGLFGGTGSRGSGGKPFGESEKDKWYIIGALGTVAFLGALAYFEMGYKEIGWKEFVHA